jgi:hypothetical protein
MVKWQVNATIMRSFGHGNNYGKRFTQGCFVFCLSLCVCFLTSSVLSIISIILIRKGVSPAGSVIRFLHHMDAGVVPAQLYG